jgi:hypothetical protein
MRRSILPRRPNRHTVKIPCSIVRERDFRLVADRVLNLSADGMLAGPADPVLTGEKLIVSFKSPRWGIWIDTEATVARVVHGRRFGEHRRALGIQFDDLAAFSKFVLEHTLCRLPPSPPGIGRALRPRGAFR